MVGRGFRDDLHCHVEILRLPGKGVGAGGRGQVRIHVGIRGPGRHEPLVPAVSPGQIGHDGAGNPDIDIMPVKEILVLDVAAAQEGGLSVQESKLTVVPVRSQAREMTVQEKGRAVEGVHLRVLGQESLQRRTVILGIG